MQARAAVEDTAAVAEAGAAVAATAGIVTAIAADMGDGAIISLVRLRKAFQKASSEGRRRFPPLYA